MSWRKKPKVFVPDALEDQQKAAENAVILATVGYADALNQEQTARRVARGHRRIQRENHLGEKMFGRTA